LIVKYDIENDPEYTRNLYQAWTYMREKRAADAREAAKPKQKIKDEKGNLIKKQEPKKEKVYKEGEPRPITLDEFIQDGYLLKSLDLPTEVCDHILGTSLGNIKQEIPPPNCPIRHMSNTLGLIKPRADPSMTLSI